MMAPRHSGPSTNNPTIASATGVTTLIADTFAGGTVGSRQVSTEPRSGNRSPNTTIATMMTRNGKP